MVAEKKDDTKVSDSDTIITSIVLESVSISELASLVLAVKLIEATNDGSRLSDPNVGIVSIELDTVMITLVTKDEGSLVSADRLLDWRKFDSESDVSKEPVDMYN